ncbi:MAG: ATP-binding protein, partial [Desulfobacterales bacterium]|nr:ATP-binding protein [Desulfobacterales bacterium]
LGQQLKLREIEVQLDLDDNIPHIMADNNKLEQVFINLVVNARDAIEEKGKPGGKVSVRSFFEKGQVKVSVSDTGTGIPEDIIDKIFEPFFTTKEVGKGTGLGMSISYGIIKDYGGTIKVKSQVGLGTSFELEFPAILDA